MIRVIAEIGSANNNPDYAVEAAGQAAGAGCWAAKYQLYSADTLTTRNAPRYESLGDGPLTQYEQFKDALPYDAWGEIFDEVWDRKLEVFASCWDEASVEWADDYGVNWFKIGSGDITHHRLLKKIAATGKQVFLSTGAATASEIEAASNLIRWGAGARQPILFACTLSYPCSDKDARLERISWLKQEFGGIVGYSDHTRGIGAAALAVAAGAEYLEKHFTITPGAGGDHDFALDKDGMAEYVWAAEQAWDWVHSETPIGLPLQCEQDARRLARRSLRATEDIPEGAPLGLGRNIAFVRPGDGDIPADMAVPRGDWKHKAYGAGDPIELL